MRGGHTGSPLCAWGSRHDPVVNMPAAAGPSYTTRKGLTTHEDLATVLGRVGRIDEAREALQRSLAIWERKGCLPCAERVREQLDSPRRAQV